MTFLNELKHYRRLATRFQKDVRNVLATVATHASLSRRSFACSAMNESLSFPDFRGRTVLPLGQEDFQFNGRGRIVFAGENLGSLNLTIAVAEVRAILQHRRQT